MGEVARLRKEERVNVEEKFSFVKDLFPETICLFYILFSVSIDRTVTVVEGNVPLR